MGCRVPWMESSLQEPLPAGSAEGHPVVFFPGLGMTNLPFAWLMQYARSLGHEALPWGEGVNLGPRQGLLKACCERIERLAHQRGQAVSLVGWSIGGVYVREIARRIPGSVRCVVTLGAPFAPHPVTAQTRELFVTSATRSLDDEEQMLRLAETPPVPTTSVYSRFDLVVPWQASLNPVGERCENVEVVSSHIGLAFHPGVYLVMADRLAQDPLKWCPFAIEGFNHWVFARPAAWELRREWR